VRGGWACSFLFFFAPFSCFSTLLRFVFCFLPPPLPFPFSPPKGPLPALGDLPRLEAVDLSGNLFRGRIPESVGKLAKCQHLWLNFNRLSGPVPASLNEAKQLRTLSLSENRLTGRLPGGLGELGKLRKLLLASNKLTGRIPWELGNLSSLAELQLGGNAFAPDTDQTRARRQKQLPNCRISI